MKRVVVDASAVVALTFQETEGDSVAVSLDGATVYAPHLLKFEVANAALTKMRQEPEKTVQIMEALHHAFDRDWGITWHDIDTTDVALVARATGLTAYDASYLWLAGYLEADLVTLDKKIIAASARIDI